MGIHGIFKQIGVGRRISLAKFSCEHFTRHNRPLRLAIDISIWLFQIQSGKGGSNPALRTFYYRLLRLLNLNVHPLFVFDGPNKPLFKRNKKVGGPGVRVASVPEFLAKQLLKQFGFPWHVAPGEAEAECAVLQRVSIVDAVLSEDVDTLMFGSNVTIRNWTPEGSTKTPTHVNLYRSDETKLVSGLDPHGMILVALMSGGDYLPDGIPGCGPKLACDAARAGFGQDLCLLDQRDSAALRLWRDRLTHQIQTNEGRHFARKTPSFKMPDEFPNLEVLGYYTHPCVSSSEKLARLQESLHWDSAIDFAALRTFTADAFDWRCLGGAQKFIKNLAPAMLTRELCLRRLQELDLDEEAQAAYEKALITDIHGKRNHFTTDGLPEYRVSYIPSQLVPIDLSIEEEDDGQNVAGQSAGPDDDLLEGDVHDDLELEQNPPGSPTKRARQFRPFDPAQPDKLWLLHNFLQVGCPLSVELYESKMSQKLVKATQSKKGGKAGRTGGVAPTQRTLLRYAKITKSKTSNEAELGTKPSQSNVEVLNLTESPNKIKNSIVGQHARPNKSVGMHGLEKGSTSNTDIQRRDDPVSSKCSGSTVADEIRAAFRVPNSNLDFTQDQHHPLRADHYDNNLTHDPIFQRQYRQNGERQNGSRKTPRKKRASPNLDSPCHNQSNIIAYLTPSPHKGRTTKDFVSLLSSSPTRPQTPTPPDIRHNFVRSPVLAELEGNSVNIDASSDYSPSRLPDTVTKRRKKGPLRRHRTAPVDGEDVSEFTMNPCDHSQSANSANENLEESFRPDPAIDALDLTFSSPAPTAIRPIIKPISYNPNPIHEIMTISDSEDAAEPGACNYPSSTTHVRDSTTQCSPQRSPRRQKLIRIRESLAGAWSETPAKNPATSRSKDERSRWRMSMIETVDMTSR